MINAAARAIAEKAAANARESIEVISAEQSGSRDSGTSASRPLSARPSRTQKSTVSADESRKTAAKPPTKAQRRWPRIVLRVVLACFVVIALVLLCTEIWLFNNWAALSVDEIVYHLRSSLQGTNTSTITDYIRSYGTIEIVGAAAIVALLVISWRRFAPKAQRIVLIALLAFGIGAATYAISDFNSRVGLFNYIANLSQQPESTQNEGEQADFIGMNYVDPSSVDLSFPQEKRNLIFIYLESMELTFADEANGGAFPENVIPELCALASEGECFAGDDTQLNGGYALPGSTWTTGAMFASTSGAPLKLPFNSSELTSEDDFFPAMVTLGDILSSEGYAQELLIGSQASFGGRDLYYESHGGFKIADYDYAIETGLIPEDYFVWWGYEDDKLFSFAKSELQQLAAGSEPFNLTMLTVDTHFPDGWPCKLCGSVFNDQYSNVLACSSKQVSSFVQWIQQQDFYENTTIVIMGDHPTMDADYCVDVPSSYDRRVFTAIINPAPEALATFDSSERRTYSTLDMFPTTLAALGANISENRLGLGTNLFSNVPTLVERYGLAACEEELEKPSSFLESFSDAKITAYHLVDASHQDHLWIQRESDGTLTFVVTESALNPAAINDVKITISDRRTGFSRALPTTISANESDPNVFYYAVHTDMTEEDLPYLSLTATISTDNFKNYPLCKLDASKAAEEELVIADADERILQ